MDLLPQNALFWCALFNGYIETVRMILEHGGNPGIRNNNQKHAYALAIDAGHEDVAGLLKRYKGESGRFLGLF